MQCMPRVRLLLLCQTFTSSYLRSHQKQGWVDFNTVNHHCTVGMDFHKFRISALAILPKSRITDLPNVSQIKIRIQEYCLAKPPPANKVRFGRLLLVLPAINKFRWNFRILRKKKNRKEVTKCCCLEYNCQLSTSQQSLESLFFKRTLGNIGVDRLIADLSQVKSFGQPWQPWKNQAN